MNMIRVYWTHSGWMSDWAGHKDADRIRETFNTTEPLLPLPFTAECCALTVKDAIQSRNPDAVVTIG